MIGPSSDISHARRAVNSRGAPRVGDQSVDDIGDCAACSTRLSRPPARRRRRRRATRRRARLARMLRGDGLRRPAASQTPGGEDHRRVHGAMPTRRRPVTQPSPASRHVGRDDLAVDGVLWARPRAHARGEVAGEYHARTCRRPPRHHGGDVGALDPRPRVRAARAAARRRARPRRRTPPARRRRTSAATRPPPRPRHDAPLNGPCARRPRRSAARPLPPPSTALCDVNGAMASSRPPTSVRSAHRRPLNASARPRGLIGTGETYGEQARGG